jgi:hypothetical protein
MEFDDHMELPEGDFIPGIYNYCNSWCKRCMYTDKCRTFATEKIFLREIEAQKRREKSMEENKDFWDQVNKTIGEAAELIDEEIPLIKNDNSLLFGQWEDDEDAEEAMKEHKEKQEKAKDQDMSKVALKYETLGSSYEEEEDHDLFDGFQKDSEGSAMVALKGIDSSIGAWGYLLGKLFSERETIKPIIRMLLWLKMEVEKEFPNAKGFQWPPKLEEE